MPTDAQLQQLSDAASFKSAQSYVRSGAVEITARRDTQIDAIVSGTEDYSVRLLLGGREAEREVWASDAETAREPPSKHAGIRAAINGPASTCRQIILS